MAIVGIVGGLGPESTIDYYRKLIEAWQKHHPGRQPSIVIDSLDVQTGLRLAGGDREGLTEYLAASIQRLAGASVDFVAMSANTPHLVFDELAARSPVPMLSIVVTCATEARRLGLKRLGLLGTRFTMEAGFYPREFEKHGITVVSPSAEERLWVHERYVTELLNGDFRETTRSGMLDVVGRMRREHDIDGLILGGTELPLLLQSPMVAGLPTLDTTALHIAAIDARLLALEN